MSYVSLTRTDANDNITLEHSAKYASGTTRISTTYVPKAKQPKPTDDDQVKQLKEKLQREMRMMEIEDENYLVELQDRLQKLTLKTIQNQKKREEERQALHQKVKEIRAAAETSHRLKESTKKRPFENKLRTDEGEETIYENQAVKKFSSGDAQKNMRVSEPDSKSKTSNGNKHNDWIATMMQEANMKQNEDTKLNQAKYKKQQLQRELKNYEEEIRQLREKAYAEMEKERAARERRRRMRDAEMAIKLSQLKASIIVKSKGSRKDKNVNPITASILSYNATNKSNRIDKYCTAKISDADSTKIEKSVDAIDVNYTQPIEPASNKETTRSFMSQSTEEISTNQVTVSWRCCIDTTQQHRY